MSLTNHTVTRDYAPLDSSHGRFRNLKGKAFGRLMVIELLGRHNGRTFWLCRCECGVTTEADRNHLLSGRTQSCGCYRKETTSEKNMTHGCSHTKTYKSWTAAKQRCLNPENADYPDYGGRGIVFAASWMQFENFLADMGMRPEGLSLDRIDPDKGYEPGNCRWATDYTQSNNRRSVRLITFRGETKSLTQWAETFGLRKGTLHGRLGRGMSFAEAVGR